MTADYTANPSRDTVEALAVSMGKNTRAIIAKLSNLGIYVKAERKGVTKTGEPVQAKQELADAIGAVLRLSEPDIDSLTKANKKALQEIFSALANSKPLD
jgi:hypothetical protein